jgi:cytochrome P450
LDEREHPDAGVYDIHRTAERSLIFGHGQHKCIGEHLAVRMGSVMLDELFSAIESYDVDFGNCRRKYAEFVKGFNSVPVRFTVRRHGRGTTAEETSR